MVALISSYILAFIISLILSSLGLAIWMRTKKGIDNTPSYKNQRQNIGIGELIFISAFLFSIALTAGGYRIITAIAIGGAIILLIGEIEARRGLAWQLKLIGQIAAGLIVAKMGIKVEFITNPYDGYFYLGWMSWPITIAWLVLIVNSVSLTNEIKGMTSGIVAISSLAFSFIAWQQEQTTAVILALALGGAALAFWRYDISSDSSEMRLSKTASTFLGLILGIIAISGVLKSAATFALILPILVLGVPIFGTSYALVASYARGGSIFSDNRIYLYGKLRASGLNDKQIVIIMYIITIYLCFSALILSRWASVYALGFLGSFGAAFLWSLRTGLLTLPRAISQGYYSEPLYPERIQLLGVRIDRINTTEALERIESFITEGTPHLVVTPDTLAIVRAQTDEEYRRIIATADLVTPDGSGILWGAKMLGTPLLDRVTGIDTFTNLCSIASKKGYTLFLLGAREEVIAKAAANLSERYPGLKIVGYHNGYFQGEEDRVIQEIREKKPDMLFVGLEAPHQEKWLSRNLSRLQVPVCMGVGGSFDVLSGNIRRAPRWMQRHSLEWLYRLYLEPRKRVKRAMLIPKFMVMVMMARMISRGRLKEDDYNRD